MAKLWDKGFEPDKMIEEYTVGDDRELDMRLARYDVEGSLAHIAMLEKIGLLTAEELSTLTAGLREIARVLRFPAAMKLESFSKGRLELVEYRVAEHTALDGTRLSELYRNFKVRVLICAVARQGETIIPSGDFTLRAGDKIYLTAARESREKSRAMLNLLEWQLTDWAK